LYPFASAAIIDGEIASVKDHLAIGMKATVYPAAAGKVGQKAPGTAFDLAQARGPGAKQKFRGNGTLQIAA